MDTTRPSLLLRIRDPADGDAWCTFDAIYRPMLHRFALARGLRHEEAEDVTQHCMAAVAGHIGSFEYDPTRGRFKSWLRTLVNNRVRNLHRKCAERPARTGELQRQEGREPPLDEVFDRIWTQEHLWHCLRELRGRVDETTFRAFRMHVVEEQPVERVCAELGLTAGNVYTIKWRLTESVAQRMRELAGDDGTVP